MSLDSCKKLLAHYESIGDEVNAEVMRQRVAHKLTLPKYTSVKKESKGKDGKK
tara:strand:- start:594 stop:752 length:159 start_codon:yes stop_codon:yes gene_type:complete